MTPAKHPVAITAPPQCGLFKSSLSSKKQHRSHPANGSSPPLLAHPPSPTLHPPTLHPHADMPGLAAADASPPAAAPAPRRLSSPLPSNPDLGPFLLKQARDAMVSGEGGGAARALEFAERAARALERRGEGAELELAMSLHVAAAIHCGLGRHADAVPVLERAVAVVTPPAPAAEGEEAPQPEEEQVVDERKGEEWALAAFSGWMQLGDTHAMLGRMDESIACYGKGFEIQMAALGDRDPRVAETCRYLAEAHVQALQFDEAEKLCRKALEIHREHSAPASLEEASDRRLMALILDAKGDYDGALEHLVLASMTMVANGRDVEVATIDVAIGNTYLALARFDESVFSYQKALTVLKSARGDDHPSVASVFVRLADLYHRTGKLRESKSYCENALRVYAKPAPGAAPDEVAGGLMEIAAIYEALGDLDEALKLLQRALKLLEDSPGQWSTVAGIEAQMGVLYYMIGRYADSRNSFESAVSKLRASGERKSAFFGVLLNQMGLACVQLFKIDEAAQLFEEARAVLEQECGASHPDTLGVYSNLAAIYDAMGRVEDAIEILEHVLKVREEKLGTANPDVEDEKKRLAELLKEAGRSRNRKQKSLENLFGSGGAARGAKKDGAGGRRWTNFGFRS
ncbi:protein KINESIN LIGHT CHAIN-RELATED 1-like [Triticum dicoccoides]|uniref:protein KINESIN LIGHT CHAIN-RELATED 1-like n=1 Tax=Triticum dicoccoides TaxID=85692 RepID=UPI001891EBB0|nr:protein KINESIN LIGHT CHAIN-RELATED 1-like [Triticum dicoccoides]